MKKRALPLIGILLLSSFSIFGAPLGFTGGLETLPPAIAGADTIDDAQQWQRCMVEGGDSAAEQDLKSAIGSFEQALQIARKFGNSDSRLWQSLRKLGWVYTLSNQFDKAEDALKQSLLLEESQPTQEAIAGSVASLYGLARLYQSEHKYNQALDCCDRASRIASGIKGDISAYMNRIAALKTELALMNIEESLNQKSQMPENEPLPEHPLIGSVRQVDVSSPPAGDFKTEIPAFDGDGNPQPASSRVLEGVPPPVKLKGSEMQSFNTAALPLDGSIKLRQQVSKMLWDYGTVGLYLTKGIGAPAIVGQTLPGGSAQLAGLVKGDEILSIDGQATNGMSMTQLHFLFTGKPGQVRTLEIQRPSQVLTISLPLRRIYEMGNRNSEYIEYYWFLLYNNLITPEEYERLSKPYTAWLTE